MIILWRSRDIRPPLYQFYYGRPVIDRKTIQFTIRLLADRRFQLFINGEFIVGPRSSVDSRYMAEDGVMLEIEMPPSSSS